MFSISSVTFLTNNIGKTYEALKKIKQINNFLFLIFEKSIKLNKTRSAFIYSCSPKWQGLTFSRVGRRDVEYGTLVTTTSVVIKSIEWFSYLYSACTSHLTPPSRKYLAGYPAIEHVTSGTTETYVATIRLLELLG